MRTGPMKGETITEDVRCLARTIMRAVLACHRRPRFERLNPWIDQRQAAVIHKAPGTGGAALSSLWVSIRGMARAAGRNGKPLARQAVIRLPLQSHGFFEARGGQLARSVQLIERPASAHAVKTGRATHRLACGRPGELVFGLVSDMEEAFAESRMAYQPLREELALDFGLAAMFVTPDGDLLGRRWFEDLRRHDARIEGLARKLQRQGLKPKPLAALPRPGGGLSGLPQDRDRPSAEPARADEAARAYRHQEARLPCPASRLNRRGNNRPVTLNRTYLLQRYRPWPCCLCPDSQFRYAPQLTVRSRFRGEPR